MSLLHLAAPAALVLAGSLLAAPCAAQDWGTDTYVLSTFHFADGDGQHHPATVCESFAGSCSASMPFSTVSAHTTLGSTSGSLAVSSIGRDGAGSASLDGMWWDTFTVTSDTLPFGTPVELSVRVDLDALVMASAFAPAPYTRAQAGLTYGGRDGPGMAFASTQDGFSLSNSGSRVQVVGQTFVLYGRLLAFSDTSWQVGPDAGSVNASARYFVDILTPGASYTTASGHDYSLSPVPDAPAWAAWLAGLALLGGWRQHTTRSR